MQRVLNSTISQSHLTLMNWVCCQHTLLEGCFSLKEKQKLLTYLHSNLLKHVRNGYTYYWFVFINWSSSYYSSYLDDISVHAFDNVVIKNISKVNNVMFWINFLKRHLPANLDVRYYYCTMDLSATRSVITVVWCFVCCNGNESSATRMQASGSAFHSRQIKRWR